MNEERARHIFARFVFVILFLFCLISVITLRVERNELQKELDECRTAVSDCEYRLAELEYECSLDTDAFIERYARQNGCLLPGEILFTAED